MLHCNALGYPMRSFLYLSLLCMFPFPKASILTKLDALQLCLALTVKNCCKCKFLNVHMIMMKS